jgi:hypothetical protein
MIPRRRPRFYQGEFKDLLKSILQKKVAEGDAVEVFEKNLLRIMLIIKDN